MILLLEIRIQIPILFALWFPSRNSHRVEGTITYPNTFAQSPTLHLQRRVMLGWSKTSGLHPEVLLHHGIIVIINIYHYAMVKQRFRNSSETHNPSRPGNTGEKENLWISSGNLAIQWHSCNYLKLQKCHCTAKFSDEIRNFSFSVALLLQASTIFSLANTWV